MQEIFKKLVLIAIMAAISFIISSANVAAQDETLLPAASLIENPDSQAAPVYNEQSKEVSNAKVISLLDIIRMGGVVGYLIILLSVVAMGLILDYSLTIRKNKLIPPEDIQELSAMIEKNELNEIDKLDLPGRSFLSRVTFAGLKEEGMGYKAMIKAMEDAGEALSSGISRKIEHLNVIGNISPMMGLLGTVIGMLRCFNEIANMPGAIEPKQLAGGIFEALVTTCMGLIVAIPSLYSYAVFRNRIDEYTGQASLMAERLVSSFKTVRDGE